MLWTSHFNMWLRSLAVWVLISHILFNSFIVIKNLKVGWVITSYEKDMLLTSLIAYDIYIYI